MLIPHILDTTLRLIPYPYILLSTPKGIPLAEARPTLTIRQALLLDLRLGAVLKQLHSVENDWFGPPSFASDSIFSWQEAFTLMLEEALCAAEERDSGIGVSLPMQKLRACLSRAIGSYLFDDAEVPAAVWFMGAEDAIFVDVGPGEDVEPKITALVGLSQALWGDPLMERLFIKPSAAMLEGYGGSLIVFPRQKTKRVWYTLYTALVVLLQVGDQTDDAVRDWAKQALDECVQQLKDAPCY